MIGENESESNQTDEKWDEKSEVCAAAAWKSQPRKGAQLQRAPVSN